jgi:Tol biopolymer transport system component
MKFIQLVFILGYAITVFASDSPDTREISDPKLIVSSAAEGVAPISVDDLFYTRSIGAGAWSPDGKQIVFITNLTGRNNLWKVSSDGGWPVQLSQSDDRQSGAAWSPDGKWIVFQSDRAGDEMYDIYAIPSDGGAVVNLTNTPISPRRTRHGHRTESGWPSSTNRRRRPPPTSPFLTGAHTPCAT